ncbi:hypothetical protein [Cupriavidus campinensis]|uniref:hypothetical protein n=1 Tax=Cupriavidus campinensis TaxID=151783 RepID=UPI001BA45CED|nr:hypothetical protein [Cupriavidus campinensis]
MRVLMLCLLLTGCAAPPPAAPAPRDCPTLPTLKPGAGRADMLDHIRVTADLYARCAATI